MKNPPTIDLNLAIGKNRTISRYLSNLLSKYDLPKGEEGIQEALRRAVAEASLCLLPQEVTEAHMWAHLIHLDR